MVGETYWGKQLTEALIRSTQDTRESIVQEDRVWGVSTAAVSNTTALRRDFRTRSVENDPAYRYIQVAGWTSEG